MRLPLLRMGRKGIGGIKDGTIQMDHDHHHLPQSGLCLEYWIVVAEDLLSHQLTRKLGHLTVERENSNRFRTHEFGLEQDAYSFMDHVSLSLACLLVVYMISVDVSDISINLIIRHKKDYQCY